MDAQDNAVVRIEERTMRGWDLARATSQDLHVDDARLDQVDQFFELFASRSPLVRAVRSGGESARACNAAREHRRGHGPRTVLGCPASPTKDAVRGAIRRPT